MRNGNLHWHLMLFWANAEQKQAIWLFCSCYHNTQRHDIFIWLNDSKILAGTSAEPGLNVIHQGKQHFWSTMYYKQARTAPHVERRMQWNTCAKTAEFARPKKKMYVKFNLAHHRFFRTNYVYFLSCTFCKPLKGFCIAALIPIYFS